MTRDCCEALYLTSFFCWRRRDHSYHISHMLGLFCLFLFFSSFSFLFFLILRRKCSSPRAHNLANSSFLGSEPPHHLPGVLQDKVCNSTVLAVGMSPRCTNSRHALASSHSANIDRAEFTGVTGMNWMVVIPHA